MWKRCKWDGMVMWKECRIDVYCSGCFTGDQTAQDLLVDHASAGSRTSKSLCGVQAPHWLRSSIPSSSTIKNTQEASLAGPQPTCKAVRSTCKVFQKIGSAYSFQNVAVVVVFVRTNPSGAAYIEGAADAPRRWGIPPGCCYPGKHLICWWSHKSAVIHMYTR